MLPKLRSFCPPPFTLSLIHKWVRESRSRAPDTRSVEGSKREGANRGGDNRGGLRTRTPPAPWLRLHHIYIYMGVGVASAVSSLGRGGSFAQGRWRLIIHRIIHITSLMWGGFAYPWLASPATRLPFKSLGRKSFAPRTNKPIPPNIRLKYVYMSI